MDMPTLYLQVNEPGIWEASTFNRDCDDFQENTVLYYRFGDLTYLLALTPPLHFKFQISKIIQRLQLVKYVK